MHRATVEEIDRAFTLVNEYYEEAKVIARENREQFAQQYFAEDSGLWLAVVNGATAGCVALRSLGAQANCGEIKRMYVRSSGAMRGIAPHCSGRLKSMPWNRTTLALSRYNGLYASRLPISIRKTDIGCERYNDNPQATLFMRKRIPRA